MTTRRQLICALPGLLVAARGAAAPGSPVGVVEGLPGAPRFRRVELGRARARLHEACADAEGNLWTSPLDGTLWRHHAATGATEVLDLKAVTGEAWEGLHIWPVALGGRIGLACPTVPQLWVLDPRARAARAYDYPHANPQVYGGFPYGDEVLLFDAGRPGLIRWNPKRDTGVFVPCPYPLGPEFYLTFGDAARREAWGGGYSSNHLVRFDLRGGKWNGHFQAPDADATLSPASGFVGETLWVSDHLNGRILPFEPRRQTWGAPVLVPGFKDWFGYLSGGHVHRGLLYFTHSTWTGGQGSLDGRPHRFLGRLSVFDPSTRAFGRLDVPAAPGESFQADYFLTLGGEMFVLAVDANAPGAAVVLRTG